MKKYVIAILMVLMITGSAGAWQWFPIASSIVDGVTNQCPDGNSVFDALAGKLSSVASDSDWTVHGSYPATCTNQFIRALGDTNTCASVGIADLASVDFGGFTCNGSTCAIDSDLAVVTISGTSPGYTGTPNIINLPNGTFMTAWKEGTTEFSSDGLLKYSIGTIAANGRDISWSAPATLHDTTSTNDANPAFIIDGSRIYLFHNHRASGDVTSDTYMQYSDDNGGSWSAEALFEANTSVGARNGIKLSNGTLIIARHNLDLSGSYFWYCSTTCGTVGNWTKTSNLTHVTYIPAEATMFESDIGHIFAYFRDESGAGVLLKAESYNYGVTWGSVSVVTGLVQSQAPQALYKMTNNATVLLFDNNNEDYLHRRFGNGTNSDTQWADDLILEYTTGNVRYPSIAQIGSLLAYVWHWGAGSMGSSTKIHTWQENMSATSTQINNFTGPLTVTGDGDIANAFTLEHASNVYYGANFVGKRSKGTIENKTIVADGNLVTGMIAQGYDGSDYRSLGRAVFYIDGTPGASDMPGRFEIRTTPDGSATEQTRVVVKNDGNVGIGVTVPVGKVDIAGNLNFSAYSISAALTATLSTGGAVDAGTHYYKVTYTNLFGETTVGTISTVVTNDVTNNRNLLTNIPLGPGGTTGRSVYRSTTSGGTYYKITSGTGASITNNTATTLTDDASDATIAGYSAVPESNTTAGADIRVENTTRVVVKNDGNVGIGTTAPEEKLQVSGAIALTLNIISSFITGATKYDPRIYATGNSGSAYPFLTAGNLILQPRVSTNGYDIVFATNNGTDVNSRMVIKSSGNVGIGTTTPLAKLHIAADQADADFRLYSANTGGSEDPAFSGYSSRGTIATPLAVGSDDKLLDIIGWGYDGATYKVGGRIQITADGTVFSGIVPGLIKFSTTDTAGTSQERMRITSSGNVGIGNTAPSGRLVVSPPASQTIAAGNTVTANGCGTIKQITAAGAVTTDTTNTFTAPAAANTGCCMDVVNVGAENITLDNNALFKSAGAADVVLGAADSVRVCSNGSAWYQIGATGNN